MAVTVPAAGQQLWPSGATGTSPATVVVGRSGSVVVVVGVDEVVAVVGGTTSHVEDVMDEIERWVWTQPGIEVLSMDRTWMED